MADGPATRKSHPRNWNSFRPDVSDLWAAYAAAPTPSLRLALIDAHLPFTKMLAAKAYAQRVLREAEFFDFYQLAVVGLLESFDRFDLSKGVPFEAYATLRIQGSILNGVERLTERSEQIALRARLKRERRDSLSSREPDAPQESLFEQLASIAIGLAIGYMLEDSGMYSSEEGSYSSDIYQSHEVCRMRASLTALIDLLPEKEQTVIKYHYLFGFPFDQIGDFLGVSKGRVSQLHKAALTKLRALNQQTARLDLKL